jgi:peptidoglycan-N-acetylglucosamine deacetylase
VTGSGVIESPAKVLEMWTLEAEAHHAAGSCFVLTNHPFISGRPSKAVALEQLISRVKGMDGMWVTTLAGIAEHTRDTVTEVHSHARIEVPAFPDAGARFTPAQVRQSEVRQSELRQSGVRQSELAAGQR